MADVYIVIEQRGSYSNYELRMYETYETLEQAQRIVDDINSKQERFSKLYNELIVQQGKVRLNFPKTRERDSKVWEEFRAQVMLFAYQNRELQAEFTKENPHPFVDGWWSLQAPSPKGLDGWSAVKSIFHPKEESE